MKKTKKIKKPETINDRAEAIQRTASALYRKHCVYVSKTKPNWDKLGGASRLGWIMIAEDFFEAAELGCEKWVRTATHYAKRAITAEEALARLKTKTKGTK